MIYTRTMVTVPMIFTIWHLLYERNVMRSTILSQEWHIFKHLIRKLCMFIRTEIGSVWRRISILQSDLSYFMWIWNDKVCDFYLIFPSLDWHSVHVPYGKHCPRQDASFSLKRIPVIEKTTLLKVCSMFNHFQMHSEAGTGKRMWNFTWLGTLVKMKEYLMNTLHNILLHITHCTD